MGRDYKKGIVEAMVALCQGHCYWPEGCDNPVIEWVRERPVVALEVAHIHAKKAGGPRFDPELEDPDIFDNLLLLCWKHHREVDTLHPEDYPANMLRAWKTTREADGLGILRSEKITTEILQLVVEDTVAPMFSKIEGALDELAAHNQEAADMLRAILSGIERFEWAGARVDADTAQMMLQAGQLLNRSLNELTVVRLHDASQKMMGLEHRAEQMSSAAENWSKAAGQVDQMTAGLNRAARNIEDALSRASQFM